MRILSLRQFEGLYLQDWVKLALYSLPSKRASEVAYEDVQQQHQPRGRCYEKLSTNMFIVEQLQTACFCKVGSDSG